MKILSRLRFFFILIIGLTLMLSIRVFAADEAWFSPSLESITHTLQGATGGKVQKEGYDFGTQNNLEASLVCQISGCGTAETINNPKFPYNPQHSALASVGGFIDSMYQNPPASTYAFLMDTGQSLGFVPKQAYAQGIGFSGLAPLLPLWKVFRNIAYLLMAIVMVVVGFMVMLRQKIDPKTVVTVQNALPRIVISLILITFSYAIVGIVIDFMYLVILLSTAVIGQTGNLPKSPDFFHQLFNNTPTLETVMTNGNLFQINDTLFPGNIGVGPYNFNPTIWSLARNIIGWDERKILVQATTVIGGILGSLGGLGIGTLAGAAVGAEGPPIIVYLLLSLALLFTFVRLFFMFLSAYVNIILSLLVAPLQLMMDAFPGGNGFDSWFKNLLSNIIVFPIAAIMFLLAMFFINASTKVSGNLWVAPYVTVGASPQGIAALFAIGVLMVIPGIVNSIKEALKAKAPIPVGPGAIISPIGGAYQTGVGALSQFYYGSQIFGEHGPFGKWIKPKSPSA